MKRLRKLYYVVTGAPAQFSLEHRIFNISSLVVAIFAVIATLLNYMLGLHPMTVWLGVAGSLVPMVLFYFSRYRYWFTPTTIYVYIVGTISILGTMHFYNGGSSGTVIYLIVMLLNIFLLIAQRNQQIWVYATLGGTIFIILVLEYMNPGWVVPYTSFGQQMGDHITVLLYVCFFMMMTIRLFRTSYEKDRETILEQKKELEQAYNTTREKNQQIESLIRELHHRVKNNLQVVSSLMALQSNRLEDDRARQALEEGRTRVDAMAMIHQKLYMDKELAAVDIRDYLENLSASLANSFGFARKHIETRVEMDQTTLDIDMAIPIGLIVNELVTNAFKHAFDKTMEPKINVSLLHGPDGSIELRVADNGKGMDETADHSASFGMKLVHTLVEQLNGTIEHQQEKGTVYNIRIRA